MSMPHRWLARAIAPDVCLLDIGLGEVDGEELAQRLRAQPETSRSVLIALTGYGQEQHRKKAGIGGFDCHLTKPVNSMVLTEILAQIRPA
jgi:CheY-like chemotaxis protein